MDASQIQTMLAEAARLHQAGHLDQAARLYQNVLAVEPGNADGLHLLGLLAYQTGQAETAVGLIRKAIAVNGREASFHFHLARALKALGRLDEAASSYRRALSLKPNDADSYNNLGNVLAEAGKFDEAVSAYRRALDLAPDNARALGNLASALAELGRVDEAEVNYRKAIALAPDYADAHNNLGNVLRDKGDLDRALLCYRRALALTPRNADAHNNLGVVLRDIGRHRDAMASYRQALALEPHHVEALSNLAIVLWESGALDEAEAVYRRIHALRPDDPNQLNGFAALLIARGAVGAALDMIRHSLAIRQTPRARKLFVDLVSQSGWTSASGEIRALLVRALTDPWDRPARLARACAEVIKSDPVPGAMVAHASTAWPRRLEADELFGVEGLAPLADDLLLLALLTSAPNCDMALERFLTMVRGAVLNTVVDGGGGDDTSILFCSALAQQCFINEYVFLETQKEREAAGNLRSSLEAALAAQTSVPIPHLLAVAAYFPLHSIPAAARLLEREWPEPVLRLLTQQIAEPREEVRLGAEIPQLTEINDAVSRSVQSQYEENPYPRWVRIAPQDRISVTAFLTQKFPLAAFERQPGRAMTDILVAGCGTGQHSIATAQKFGGEGMLAVDLSLSSLSYARRKSRELDLHIAYAQADILELGKLGQSFDVIESIGVLHHMADPYAGWAALLTLLRPGGFMWLGFYSESGRRNIADATRGTHQRSRKRDASAAGIRLFRQELADSAQAPALASILESSE